MIRFGRGFTEIDGALLEGWIDRCGSKYIRHLFYKSLMEAKVLCFKERETLEKRGSS